MKNNSSLAKIDVLSSLISFLKELLRGMGQVMFQNSAWTGLFFMVGIFWGAYAQDEGIVAWGALLGVSVSTLTGYLLQLKHEDGEQGLWGFNGALVGCAFPTFIGDTPGMWFSLILCASLTTWVQMGLNRILKHLKLNSLNFSYVFCTWVFLLAAKALHGISPSVTPSGLFPEIFFSATPIDFVSLFGYWLKGISQIFLLNSAMAGFLFLIGLFICNPWAGLWASIGSALSLLMAFLYDASGVDISNGLYGYCAVLTAISLGCIFYRPSLKSALWALLGILVTVFVQAGMHIMMEPVGIATLTAPFCVTTWLFLLPLIHMDDQKRPNHKNWSYKNKSHLSRYGINPSLQHGEQMEKMRKVRNKKEKCKAKHHPLPSPKAES